MADDLDAQKCSWCAEPAGLEAGPGRSVTFRACDDHVERLRSIFADTPDQIRRLP